MSSVSFYHTQKRILDVVVASVLCIAFIPFWIMVPILIYLESGWPVIFKHKRLGKNGKEFELYKFRSMIKNADKLLHHNNQKLLKKFKDGDWKMKNDPRITKIGKIIRSFTIDEFPQLLNVLKGEMSMVGPRAYLKKELQEQTKRFPKTKKYLKNILSVKPGITGIWQTSGRNEIPFTQRASIDATYVQHLNITQDILILLKTPKAMLSKW